MKTSIGAKTLLYPAPVLVVGSLTPVQSDRVNAPYVAWRRWIHRPRLFPGRGNQLTSMLKNYRFGRVEANDKVYSNDIKVVNGKVIPDWRRERGHLTAYSTERIWEG